MTQTSIFSTCYNVSPVLC